MLDLSIKSNPTKTADNYITANFMSKLTKINPPGLKALSHLLNSGRSDNRSVRLRNNATEFA
jgi:hypothetical protein